jgi:hypothetical protein
MSMGGARPGAGRPKGKQNKKTEALEAAMTEAARSLPSDYTSLVLFQAVYRNAELPAKLRLYAASQALPYEHPKLATTTVKGDADAPLAVTIVKYHTPE